MNQDRVKDILLDTAPTDTEFSVVFSGKESSVANGLYKPLTREIDRKSPAPFPTWR